jgi:putative chitinase
VITRELLVAAMPGIGDRAEAWLEPLNAATAEFAIDTPARIAAFLAQVGHESTDLTRLEEKLGYSAGRMMAVWPGRFPRLEVALPYAHNPRALAEHVYGGRLGNAAEGSGDGYKYRGRGPLQLTGRDAYALCAKALALPLLDDPDQILEPAPGARSAGWVWQWKGLNPLADAGQMGQITRRINGGTMGIEDRLGRWERTKELLA